MADPLFAHLHDEVIRRCACGEYDEATTLVLRQLGPSVFRFILARLHDEDLTADAFARFSEDVWRGLPNFAGRSSIKVWVFTVARNAAGQVLRRRKRESRRSRDWTSTLASRVAEEVRTETAAHLRTDSKMRFEELRKRLSPEEQSMLILRVNEQLSWEEIARIHLGAGAGEDVKREAARLRKKFQLVRRKLRKMAVAEGLIEDAEGSPSRR